MRGKVPLPLPPVDVPKYGETGFKFELRRWDDPEVLSDNKPEAYENRFMLIGVFELTSTATD